MADAMVKHVVVDSGAFIRNAPVREIGENIYTVQDIVNEIRDKATRQRLQVLPYQLQFREPAPDAIKTVTDFAKKTGDYRSLSAVDIRLIALVYQLEKENVGTSHIKTQPDVKTSWHASKSLLEKPTEIAGFYLGNKKTGKSRSNSESSTKGNDTEEEEEIRTGLKNLELVVENRGGATAETSHKSEGATESDNSDPSKCNVTVSNTEDSVKTVDVCVINQDQVPNAEASKKQRTDNGVPAEELDTSMGSSMASVVKEGDVLPTSCLQGGDSEEEEEEEEETDEDEDEDDGWITPSNIKDVKASMGDKSGEKAHVQVGCITMDFAMQNVLIQMGLNVVSVDGMLIKRAKSYVLRCFACLKITMNLMKDFCPNCGNKTLQKVSMMVDDEGNIQYFLSRRKPVSVKGLKYSLPLPKGGKHATNPQLCEDQPQAQQRMARKTCIKYSALDPDFVVEASPFAPIDTTSRSAQLGIRQFKHGGRNRRNPNEKKKIYGRRK